MQQLARMDVIKRGIRSEVCPKCENRALDAQPLDLSEPWPCEQTCPIFAYLPEMVRLTRQQLDEPLPDYRALVRDSVCQGCTLSETAGDYCAEGFTRACPLSRHELEVVGIVERLISRRRAVR
jgi:ferredoxin